MSYDGRSHWTCVSVILSINSLDDTLTIYFKIIATQLTVTNRNQYYIVYQPKVVSKLTFLINPHMIK